MYYTIKKTLDALTVNGAQKISLTFQADKMLKTPDLLIYMFFVIIPNRKSIRQDRFFYPLFILLI